MPFPGSAARSRRLSFLDRPNVCAGPTAPGSMAITRKSFIDPPVLRKPLAFFLLVLNVIFPGFGTVIAGFLTCKLKSLFTGILQLVTAPLLFGWVWSVMWGWELWTLARRHPFTPLLDP